ncbi:hypothetical protein TSUD_317490 [Trifolium subterraneum]|uniref:Uncharacterized protein n=1 Tax=Trifolium subterraneum TaxID=3900 RepID=A0A2Z6M3N3_TRISU|nr:hypothetical protein TSUD_317490 [Trifolium subterraneum]
MLMFLMQDFNEPINGYRYMHDSAVNNLPKDSDLFLAKRNEAYQKYEILLELEKLFSPIFSKPPITNQ